MNTNTCSINAELSLDFIPSIHAAYIHSQKSRRSAIRKRNKRSVFSQLAHISDEKHSSLLPARIRQIIFVLAIIAVIAIGRFMITSASERMQAPHMNKYYTSISVQEDDTLWTIAGKYNSGTEDNNSYIRSLKKLNNMTSDTLYKGENLLIYYFSPEEK